MEFEQWLNCVYYELVASQVAPTAIQSLTAASLYIDYIYLDTEERRRFAQQTHEYLIEQLQFTGAESITSSSNKIQLNFNHPVKELVWVVQRDSYVDCTPNLVTIQEVNGMQPFNYTDDFTTEGIVMDVLARGSLGTGLGGANLPITGATFAVPTGSFDGPSGPYLPGLGLSQGPSLGGASWLDSNLNPSGNDQQFVFEDTTNYLLAKVILSSGVKCEGKNPVEVAKLQLNGQDRFTEREGRYFSIVQPFQHHTRTPAVGINVYSFALKPEEHQPSGTCNFSRIDKATLQLTVSVNTVRGGRTAQVRVYAVNYNVLRVMSGMGGLAYSN